LCCVCFQCFDAVGWVAERASCPTCKKTLSGGVLAQLSIWDKVRYRFAYGPSDATATGTRYGTDLHMAHLMPLPQTCKYNTLTLLHLFYSPLDFVWDYRVKSRLVLVPAHFSNPRQSPEGCKTDVVVCECCTCMFQMLIVLITKLMS